MNTSKRTHFPLGVEKCVIARGDLAFHRVHHSKRRLITLFSFLARIRATDPGVVLKHLLQGVSSVTIRGRTNADSTLARLSQCRSLRHPRRG